MSSRASVPIPTIALREVLASNSVVFLFEDFFALLVLAFTFSSIPIHSLVATQNSLPTNRAGRMAESFYWTLAILVFYLAISLLIVFALFCGDVSSSGFHGVLSRFLLETIPNSITHSARALLGEKGSQYLFRVYDYVVNQRNPILQIIYLGIINSAYITWLFTGQPLLPTYLIPAYHSYLVFFGVVTCQGLFFLSCSTSPGVITPETIQQYDHHPYDGTLFVEGNDCTTCKTKKIPRSKHCSLCSVCVPVFDHHCIWLNQCVGQNNYRLFLAFLWAHVLFFFYATYVSGGVILSKAYEQDLFNAQFVNRRTGRVTKASWYLIAKYLLYSNLGVMIIFVLVSVMGAALAGFLSYHLYLVSKGTTTNETFKWKDARDAYDQLSGLHKTYLQTLKDDSSPPAVALPGESPSPASEEKRTVLQMTPTGMLLRGLLDLKTPQEGGDGIPDPGTPPVNIYNQGFLPNLRNIVWPRSLYPQREEPAAKEEKSKGGGGGGGKKKKIK